VRFHLVLALHKEAPVALLDWLFGSKFKEFLTAGPSLNDHPPAPAWDRVQAGNTTAFKSGWFTDARRVDAHPGRMGGSIVPQAAVVHTTDMTPKSFDDLVKAWATTGGAPNRYSAANFLLGRDPGQGLVQMVPITRNSNHAGGPTKNGLALHGWWVTKEGRFIHPNTIAVGIEVHSNGLLAWKPGSKGVAQFIEDKKVKAEYSGDDLYVDDLNRPWHRVTEYQLETLEHLLVSLKPSLKPLAEGVDHKADAAYVKDHTRWDMSYAYATSRSLVGHASLDPINKTDPGPQLMHFINEFAHKDGWV
jgi:hypothetical protein